MRRKAKSKKAKSMCPADNGNVQVKESMKMTEQTRRLTKIPTGKGLGKAGARRLGQLLKRAIQVPEESTAKGKTPLPKTPVRLFKHQVHQTDAMNVPSTSTAKPGPPPVTQLILSVVSECKHRGKMSMADLRKTLATGGYVVTKTSRQTPDTKQVKTSKVNSHKQKVEQKPIKTASKSPKEAEWSKKQTRTDPRSRQLGKTCRGATKSNKVTRTSRSHQPRKRNTPRSRRRSARGQRFLGKDGGASGRRSKRRRYSHK